jgi:hypothetical protein
VETYIPIKNDDNSIIAAKIIVYAGGFDHQ